MGGILAEAQQEFTEAGLADLPEKPTASSNSLPEPTHSQLEIARHTPGGSFSTVSTEVLLTRFLTGGLPGSIL
ncbi:MAG: hypothetical protein IPG71_14265 [bacterium]|nr:hypothetical protein [bacterium]